jgi:diguanylate cyclase (GGDEF)-like protein
VVGAAALGYLAGRLSAERRIRRLRRLHRAAAHAASHDRLTGLPDRDLARRLFASRQRRGVATAVALIDLDDFKTVNDTHGHRVGDALLCAAAKQLALIAASCGGMTARLGGDEFLLVLPAHQADELTASAVRDLTAAVTIRGDHRSITVRPSASAGVATAHHGDFTTVVRHADIALYHAKQQPGSYRHYLPGMDMPGAACPHGYRLRDQHRDQRNRPGFGGAAS